MSPARPAMTAADVVTAVRRYGAEQDNIGPEWAALDELTSGAWGMNRRADLFLVRARAGRPKCHERIVVEVKVSRADLRAELADPTKLEVFARHAHRTYFATPAGLVKDTDDLGPGVGLIEVLPHGGTRETRKAVRRPDPEPLPEPLVVEAFRRAARAEARVRGAGAGDPAAQVVALTAELATARRAEQTARAAARRDAQRLRDWLTRVADLGGVPCVCGATLRPAKDRWRGNAHADGTACPERWSEVDFEALSVRLGLTDPNDALGATA